MAGYKYKSCSPAELRGAVNLCFETMEPLPLKMEGSSAWELLRAGPAALCPSDCKEGEISRTGPAAALYPGARTPAVVTPNTCHRTRPPLVRGTCHKQRPLLCRVTGCHPTMDWAQFQKRGDSVWQPSVTSPRPTVSRTLLTGLRTSVTSTGAPEEIPLTGTPDIYEEIGKGGTEAGETGEAAGPRSDQATGSKDGPE